MINDTNLLLPQLAPKFAQLFADVFDVNGVFEPASPTIHRFYDLDPLWAQYRAPTIIKEHCWELTWWLNLGYNTCAVVLVEQHDGDGQYFERQFWVFDPEECKIWIIDSDNPMNEKIFLDATGQPANRPQTESIRRHFLRKE